MRLLRISLLLFLFFLIIGCINQGANLEEGIHCFREQNYRHAFIRLKPFADRGQPDAQYAVGYMYYYGQGVVEDRQKAYLWICRAAKAGQAEALKAMTILEHSKS